MSVRYFIRFEINFVRTFHKALGRRLFNWNVVVDVVTVIRRDSNVYVWLFSYYASEMLVNALHTFV